MNTEEIKLELLKRGISITSGFVPWSKSRNSKEKQPSLNWKITLLKNDKPILTTDYMSGCGHCPSYKQNGKGYDYKQIINSECETGLVSKFGWSMSVVITDKKKPILPDLVSVVWSLILDSEVLDYEFEDWARNFGYDADSRQAEKIYKDCMEIALKLIRAFGSEEINQLREIYQDY